ncbi:uncharacterized protein K489DRAFT_117660 [Dissoconium aciculare CBS 342.82]|uniref:Uncharacterized protein n=1 Tax=Dissoconium aciculare CBS 342.82 TaxID=1314786 RepID=A0A6J3MES8_9PEZI|nr:uncharacterized protein K489DRAFT_117660 [Dissoconium aciculare CBS 342.82]KAF1826505.1 hypothetical protein K489DRAFT_117660 [Dissoconium aciculare CBS 342.82]
MPRWEVINSWRRIRAAINAVNAPNLRRNFNTADDHCWYSSWEPQNPAGVLQTFIKFRGLLGRGVLRVGIVGGVKEPVGPCATTTSHTLREKGKRVSTRADSSVIGLGLLQNLPSFLIFNQQNLFRLYLRLHCTLSQAALQTISSILDWILPYKASSIINMSLSVSRKRRASGCCMSDTVHTYTKRSRPTLTAALNSCDDSSRDRHINRHNTVPSVWPNAGTYSPQQVSERTFSMLSERDVQKSRLAGREFSQIVNASTALRETVERYRTPRGSGFMTPDSQSSPTTRFLSISPNGRSGTLDFQHIAHAGSWRNLSPFQKPACEVVLKIPGRFSGHPILKAPSGAMGISLGMIADAFAAHGTSDFWQGRKAEFFALRDAAMPPRVVLPRAHFDANQQSLGSYDQDAMDFEPCRAIPDFDPSRQHPPETMCFN